VRADQALLQACALLRLDVPLGQRAESGRDAVNRGVRRGQVVDVLAGPDDRLAGLRPDRHLLAAARDPHHLVRRQRPDVNDHLSLSLSKGHDSMGRQRGTRTEEPGGRSCLGYETMAP
jgi:hypothetical protein